MTDEQIIKALECCCDTKNMLCRDDCPLTDYDGVCWSAMKFEALSLIHRQKAEIEALRMDNQQLQSDIANANMNADHALAEIERLQHRISELEAELDDLKRDELPRCKDALRRANEIGMAVDKENQELKAEIERLTNTQRTDPNDFSGVLCDFAKECIAKAKADAIKEFAERLKDKVYKPGVHPGVDDEFIIVVDNLVKEMVGDK